MQNVHHKLARCFHKNIRVAKLKGFTGIQTSKQLYYFFFCVSRTMTCKPLISDGARWVFAPFDTYMYVIHLTQHLKIKGA